MRRILAVDDDLHTRLVIRAWLKRYECLSEAEPHRRYAATLASSLGGLT
jgi:CheY-like chemotaxis protein